eukprot:gene4298-4866_t
MLVGHLVPEEDEMWELFTLLKEIMDICLHTQISKEQAYYLETLIDDHHQQFLEVRILVQRQSDMRAKINWLRNQQRLEGTSKTYCRQEVAIQIICPLEKRYKVTGQGEGTHIVPKDTICNRGLTIVKNGLGEPYFAPKYFVAITPRR